MMNIILALLLLPLTLTPLPSHALVGFYAGKNDAPLSSATSKVVLAYNKGRTVVTLASDYQGDLKDFALIIPFPTPITREQIRVTSSNIFDLLDSTSAPQLIDTFDENPCTSQADTTKNDSAHNANSADVKMDAQYTVGEYDIAVLSAEQSSGLVTYLNQNGYKLPNGAEKMLGAYINQHMHFVIAKVNLKELAKLGYTTLRPLQIAYTSPKFMLPIRLGTLNAPARDTSIPVAGYMRKDGQNDAQKRMLDDGSQDLVLWVLSRNGRVEPVNTRMVKMDSKNELPVFIKDEFTDFYKTMFARRAKAEGSAVFLEYAGDADMLSRDQLKQLGVFWLDEPDSAGSVAETSHQENLIGQYMLPQAKVAAMPPKKASTTTHTFITRLHMRYNAQTFRDDLMLRETSNREDFQSQFMVRHAWQPATDTQNDCPSAGLYQQSLVTRQAHEAETLARMTGWPIESIRAKMAGNGPSTDTSSTPAQEKEWWKDLWKDERK